MDARDEGSRREPGPAAPEEGAPGATGAAPFPGPRPAGEAADGVRTGAPRTGAEPSPESGDGGPEDTASEAAQGPEPGAAPGPESGAAHDLEPGTAGPGTGAAEEGASASAESERPQPGADVPADRGTARSGTLAPTDSGGAAPAGPEEGGPLVVALPRPGGAEADAPAPVFPEQSGEPGCPEAGVPVGLAALPLPHQIAAALALALVAVVSCVHLGMVFLHVAPSNTVTKQHGRAIDDWIYPEFEQNWKLFAPNPLQQDIAVQVRALVRAEDGTSRETGWYDLSALDGLAIDGNPLPSHTQQNELRRAWDLYAGTHDEENRPLGLRGDLSERYLRRIGVLRLDREHAGGEGAVVERVQFRSLTTDVPPPRWSGEKVSDRPVVRELPWWAVPGSDRADGLTEAGAR